MARPISVGPVPKVPKGLMADPNIAPQDLEFFRTPKGLDTLSPLSEVDRSHSPAISNLILSKGTLRSRPGTESYGSPPLGNGEYILLAADLAMWIGSPAALTKVSLRWTQKDLYRFVAGDWVTQNLGHFIDQLDGLIGMAYTGWGPSLIVYTAGWNTNHGADVGLVEYNPAAGTHRLLAGAPAADHVTTFGNRVVVCKTYVTGTTFIPFPNRVQWSVKDDDNDWAGTGSGFEDLLSTSFKPVDEVMGCYPINDTTALLVRERSIWRMDLTGFVDAPFQFTLLVDGLGTNLRRTIRAVPGGVIFLGYDDAYIVTLSGPERIGLPALYGAMTSRRSDYASGGYLGWEWGYYDEFRRLYRLIVNPTLGLSANTPTSILTYSTDDKGWTTAIYPCRIVSMDHSYFDRLSERFHGMYLNQVGAGLRTLRENPDLVQDVNESNVAVDSSVLIATGLAQVDTPLRETELIEVQLEYEALRSQTLFFEWSSDGGATWTSYAAAPIVVTSKPEVLSVRKALKTRGLQVRVRSTTLGALRVITLHLFAMRGAMIHG